MPLTTNLWSRQPASRPTRGTLPASLEAEGSGTGQRHPALKWLLVRAEIPLGCKRRVPIPGASEPFVRLQFDLPNPNAKRGAK